MSTSTIENIAIGARPNTPTNKNGRRRSKKTLRRMSFQLEDLITPAHARAWQASLKESFTDPLAFDIILQDIYKLDSDFTDQLASNPTAFANFTPSPYSPLSRYQEYIDAFVSLFAHVKFGFGQRGRTENEVTESLFVHKCPKKQVFRRLVVNPFYLADENPENPEKVVLESGSIPVGQLARMCDVAILKFLSCVNEKTHIKSVVWGLDYLAEMTKRLEVSLRTQSESGWYDIAYRKRKDTIRRSVIDVPQLAVDGRPLVVGLGSTNSMINPETGQPLVPSIAVTLDSPTRALAEQPPKLDVNPFIFPSVATPPVIAPPTINNNTDKITNIRKSFEDGPAPRRRHSTVTKPLGLSTTNDNLSKDTPPQRRSSTGSRPQGILSARFPPRKTSITMPMFSHSVGIESIKEEVETPLSATNITNTNTDTNANTDTTNTNTNTDTTNTDTNTNTITATIEDSEEEEEEEVKSKENICNGRFQFSRSPSPGSLRQGLKHITPSNTSSLDFFKPTLKPLAMSPPRGMTPPSPLSSNVRSSLSPPAHESDEPSDTESDTGGDEQQRKTPELSSPPPMILVKKLTTEDIDKELHTLITKEGRISLLAILRAIIRLPSNPSLWTEDSWDACHKCFSLIQFCMDFGLEASTTSNSSSAASAQPTNLLRNRSLASLNEKAEKASSTYSRSVLRYAVKALIHCAVCTYTGCSSDSCQLGSYSLQKNSRNASQNLNKMIHQLERLYNNSPFQFREVVMEFSRQASLKEVFHFLHVILQYCPRGQMQDPLDPSLSRRDPLIVMSAAVFRIVVDRMSLLDLKEPTVKHNFVKEAISFVHFANTLFNQEFISSKGFHHLRQYVQRVACSVLLPIPKPSPPSTPLQTTTNNTSSVIADTPPPIEMGTFPRRKDKSKGNNEEEQPLGRKRGRTIGGGSFESGRSPKKSPNRKGQLTKQPSLHINPPDPLAEEDTATATKTPKEHPVITALKEEWHGLKIGALHQRIRRLTLVLELSEPGTIPEPSLLSSLFTVGSPGLVVPKALLLMECCLFVQRLNKEESTVWLEQRVEHHWDMFYLLRKWGDAVGEGLRDCIMREKEILNKGCSIINEPVFPDNDETSSEDTYTVNHSLKMLACILLLEITRFLREPPPKFIPSESSTGTINYHHIRHAVGAQPPQRKVSNMSNLSTDSETICALPISPVATVRRMSSEYQIRQQGHFDDIRKVLSVEQPTCPLPVDQRKVSIYLRVNSRYGRQTHHGPNVSIHKPATSSHVEAPSDTYHVKTSPHHSPSKRRMSLAAGVINRQGSVPHDHTSRVQQMALPTNSARLARKSFSGASGQNVAIKKDSSSSTKPSSPPTIHHQLSTGGGATSRRRPSVMSKFNGLFQRSRHAFRRPRGTGEHPNKKRPSTTTQTSSAGSSPSFIHRSRMGRSHSRQDSIYQRVEELSSDFTWLGVVEHLIASNHKVSQETRDKQRQQCNDLMSALKHIYSIEFEPEELPVTTTITNTGNKGTLGRPASHLSIGNVFGDPVVSGGGGRAKVLQHTSSSLVLGSLKMMTAPVQLTNGNGATTNNNKQQLSNQTSSASIGKNSFTQGLAKLDFSGLRLRSLLESGGVWGGFDGWAESEEGGVNTVTIDQLMETDSASSLEQLMTNYNKHHLDYCNDVLSGLLHAPFSLMTYAGPLLGSQVFRDLRKVAWNEMGDPDYKCSNAAASFFLLSCLKEKDSSKVQSFIDSTVKLSEPSTMMDAIVRFQTLWYCRDSVWPQMEHQAVKHFNPDHDKKSKDSQSIGYSLPSHWMGLVEEEIPFPSWKPLSVCTSHSCAEGICTSECFQPTHLAPLVHLPEISQMVLPYPVSMTDFTQMDVDSASTTLVEVDKDDYEQGIINIKDHVKLTLFPNTLLPLINIVIRALCVHPATKETNDSFKTTSSAHLTERSEEVLWQCMLEHPHDLFIPLLNEFNRLYQIVRDHKRRLNFTVEETAEDLLGDILKPFHILLCHFPVLPPTASRFLFNHLVGIVMRHTEQPVDDSDNVVQSILGLLRMVAPGVKGLSMKELKNQLKKESCYTTLLTTARIRGVEKVLVACPDDDSGGDGTNTITRDIVIDSEDMSFIHLIAKACDIDPASDEFPNILYSYSLKDEKTGLPVLSSLIIQDNYPVAPDGKQPLFRLYKSSIESGVWSKQLEMLQTHKMSEIGRILFACQMLLEESKNGDTLTQQRFSEPNSIFIFEELLKLSSFPRRTLDSAPYEVGPMALSKWQLRVTDTMLRGVWSKFILTLFTEMKDYQPDNSLILFLTVLNGCLLLQSEDHTILRNTLAALLTAATKFEIVFRTEGYQMVVPSLVQVHALHQKNKMVTKAIEYVWISFYWFNQNLFLLQAISSVANLFDPSVSSLATTLGVNFSPLKFASEEDEIILQNGVLEKSSIALLSCLNSREDSLPHDPMNILGACPKKVKDHYNTKPWVPCSLDQMLTLCVTVASYNPEVLRGMQVLAFLDHLMPLLAKEKDLHTALSNCVRILIKGCEAIKKSQAMKTGESLSNRRGTMGGTGGVTEPKPLAPGMDSRMSALAKQILFLKHRSGTSQDLVGSTTRERSLTELKNVPPEEQHAKLMEGFRARRINDVVHFDILHISRDSLLSIASQFVSHAAKQETPATSNNRRNPPLDVSSLSNIASIVDKTIRQGMKSNFSHMLTSKGFTATLLDLFPSIDWTHENKAIFSTLLDRAIKLFKKVQLENQRVFLTSFLWAGMESLLNCFHSCIQKSPYLVENEPILSKLKSLVDMCLVVKPTTIQSFSTGSSARTIRPFIFDAPESFVPYVVKLMAEIIVSTRRPNRRNKGLLLQSFFSGKLHFKEVESTFVWKKLFLPLAIDIGLRPPPNASLQELHSLVISSQQNDEDAFFLLETIQHVGEQIHYLIKYRSTQNEHQIERFFVELKVILAAFGNKFSVEQWMKIAHEIMTLATRYDFSNVTSSSFGDSTNGMYVRFCFMFLDFMENFLLLARLPFYSVIWHVVSVIERQLISIKDSSKLDSNDQVMINLTKCLQKCSLLNDNSSLNPVTPSRHDLLISFERQILVEARNINGKAYSIDHGDEAFRQQTSFSTSLEEPKSFITKATPKRQQSIQPGFPVIIEAAHESDTATSTDAEDAPNIVKKHSSPIASRSGLLLKRPTTLSLRGDSDGDSPSLERKTGKKSSLATPSTLHHTLTSDDESKHSPLLSTAAIQDDKVVHKKSTPTNRRKVPRNEFKSKIKVQDSFEADEEDSGPDTPKVTSSPDNAVTVTAEVHPSPSPLYISSSVDATITNRDSKLLHKTVVPHSVDTGSVQRSRPRLMRVPSIHDQPDEQTGQPRKDSTSTSSSDALFDTAVQESFNLLPVAPSSSNNGGNGSSTSFKSRTESDETML